MLLRLSFIQSIALEAGDEVPSGRKRTRGGERGRRQAEEQAVARERVAEEAAAAGRTRATRAETARVRAAEEAAAQQSAREEAERGRVIIRRAKARAKRVACAAEKEAQRARQADTIDAAIETGEKELRRTAVTSQEGSPNMVRFEQAVCGGVGKLY